MWLSKITYDLVAARKDCQEFLGFVQVPISAKRIQLQTKYGGGDGVAVNWSEVLESDIPTLTTLRSWPIKLAAQEHVDFAILQADYITATVEEQV